MGGEEFLEGERPFLLPAVRNRAVIAAVKGQIGKARTFLEEEKHQEALDVISKTKAVLKDCVQHEKENTPAGRGIFPIFGIGPYR